MSLFYQTNIVGHIWCYSNMPFVRVSAFTCNILVDFWLLHFLNKVFECLVLCIADNVRCVSGSVRNSL